MDNPKITNTKLQKAIKKAVIVEIKRAMPIIVKSLKKEMEKEIKYQISESLNNKLMVLLSEKQSSPQGSSLQEVVKLPNRSEPKAPRRDLKELRNSLRKSMGANVSEENSFLFGDIIEEEVNRRVSDDGDDLNILPPGVKPPPPQLQAGIGIIDSDDGGVDISQFGL